MPFKIASSDIIRFHADAIVNPTDELFSGKSGVDMQVHKAAGQGLDEYLSKYDGLENGEAVESPGFSLPCKYIIHTSGPRWGGGADGESDVLGRCYSNSIALARELSCKSIVFPLIGSKGEFFPPEIAFSVAYRSIIAELEKDNDIMVYLTIVDKTEGDVFDLKTVDISGLNDIYSVSISKYDSPGGNLLEEF